MTQAITRSNTQPRNYTFEEYLLTPYDGRRTELVDGEIVEVARPSQRHNRIQKRLLRALDDYAEQFDHDWAAYMNNSGVQIPRADRRDNSRTPDLVMATNAQWEMLDTQTESVFLRGNPPLLTIEVVSPGTVKKDVEDLVIEYALASVPEYWVVNPVDEMISVYVLQGNVYTLKGQYRGEQPVESELLKHWNATAAEMLC